MSRPRRGTEEVWYDTFSDWGIEDQAAALKVLEQLHRLAKREQDRADIADARAALREHDAASGPSGRRDLEAPIKP